MRWNVDNTQKVSSYDEEDDVDDLEIVKKTKEEPEPSYEEVELLYVDEVAEVWTDSTFNVK